MDVLTMRFSLILPLIIKSPDCSSAADTPANKADKQALIAFKSLITADPLMSLASWDDSSHFCNWTGVACGPNLQRFMGLNLTRLSLAGTIASQLGPLSFITILDLSVNSFQGVIPSGLGNLECEQQSSRRANHRSLSNYLIGTVPTELGSLPDLLRLYLGSNNLKGTIPSSFGSLTSMVEIDMSYNYLSSEVPSRISMLKCLKTLWFPVNYLTALDFLALPFNNLTGNSRNDIGLVLFNLIKLWLANNSFTGPHPDSFPNASKFESVELSSNNFSGTVPLNLGQLNLLTFVIGSNNLGLGQEKIWTLSLL